MLKSRMVTATVDLLHSAYLMKESLFLFQASIKNIMANAPKVFKNPGDLKQLAIN